MSNDQKKYEQMMGAQLDRSLQRKWMNEYSPNAVQHFSRAANICELCGHYMHLHPKSGREKELTEWERRWSVHEYCREAATDQLDRASNINSQRS